VRPELVAEVKYLTRTDTVDPIPRIDWRVTPGRQWVICWYRGERRGMRSGLLPSDSPIGPVAAASGSGPSFYRHNSDHRLMVVRYR
jgi:hypothetical protein